MSLVIALTIDEAAARLGVTGRHLGQLIRDGKFPAVRIGRCVRIPVEALTAWLAVEADAHMAAATPPTQPVSSGPRRRVRRPAAAVAK